MVSNCCGASVQEWNETEGRCNDCQEPCELENYKEEQ